MAHRKPNPKALQHRAESGLALDPMPSRPRRFLCVCRGGNVRSVALAYLLKYGHGQDAMAVSAECNTADTLQMLCNWADYVILLTPEVFPFLDGKCLWTEKFAMVDVGPDIYGAAFHPELQAKLKPVVDEWAAREWKL